MRAALDFSQALSPFNEFSVVRDLFHPLARSGFNPACDIEENEAAYHLSFDIPGLGKEDVKIELEDSELRISGERRLQRKEGAENRFHFSERALGKFERVFTLPATVQAEGVKARFENGVLDVTLPKAAAPKPKLIPIES